MKKMQNLYHLEGQEKNYTRKEIDRRTVIVWVGVFLIVFLIITASVYEFTISLPGLPVIQFPHLPFLPPLEPAARTEEVKQFASEQEFKDYLALSEGDGDYYGFGLGNLQVPVAAPNVLLESKDGMGSGGPERVSETNVQVAGVDEPDIVKTDGKEIYFSPQSFVRYSEPGIWIERGMPDYYPPQEAIKLINAFPPADLGLDGEIKDLAGNLLLSNKTLIVLPQYEQKIYGYDVSDAASPQKEWTLELSDNSYLTAARLYQNKLYLVTSQAINRGRPCPIEPLKQGLTIACEEIYHPVRPVPVDANFVIIILDPATGKVENKVSFVGSSGSSVVYMSEKAVYVTYTYYESIVGFMLDFFVEEANDIIPSWVTDKLKKLESYDLSQSAKMVEFEQILMEYHNSLDDDERLKVENELTNRLEDYFQAHLRDLEKSGIVKIQAADLKVVASANVPGHPLNQFALDEHEDNLRIATTSGDRFWGWGMGSGGAESINDVYILNSNLKIIGSVQDLGLGERIYSARFIKDRGYLVTFREIDPFYILDLSDPHRPEMKGELKIPGYSSYLHSISQDRILGIGKDGSKVKISLFDVSSATDPKEADKYLLDEYWSDVLNTHHAFLLDEKHQVFFLPGSNGGYVFSYKNDKLVLEKAVSEVSVKRALYLDDYLYILGDDKIVVLNELDWQRVSELDL